MYKLYKYTFNATYNLSILLFNAVDSASRNIYI